MQLVDQSYSYFSVIYPFVCWKYAYLRNVFLDLYNIYRLSVCCRKMVLAVAQLFLGYFLGAIEVILSVGIAILLQDWEN
jgi:hypothetical protein